MTAENGTWIERRLGFLDGDEPSTRLPKVRAFEAAVLLILLAEYWARAIPKWDGLATLYVAILGPATVCCLIGLAPSFRRAAFAALAVMHASMIWGEFPAAGNHAYLELLLCVLGAGLDVTDEAEQVLFLRAVRWLTILIFFYAGLQKLVHGYWTGGHYLAFSVWIDSFRPVLAQLIPEQDFTRLLSFTRQVGDGPYLVSSPLFLVVSNGSYIAEMAVAVLLALPATRRVGVVAGIGLLFAIEIAAREVFFGALVVNALLLFLPRARNARLVPVVAVVMTALLLVRLGVLPDMKFY